MNCLNVLNTEIKENQAIKRNRALGILLIIFIALVLSILSSQSVYASGFGIAPSYITIQNALKGYSYDHSIKIINGGDKEIQMEIFADGEISDWISFYMPDQPDTPVTDLNAAANSYTLFYVKVDVPADAANGEYEVKIRAKEKIDEDDDSQASQAVSLVIGGKLIVEVVGEQQLTGVVRGISTQDTESGQMLRITAQFENSGNVVAKPLFEIQILKDDEVIDEFSYQEKSFNVGESGLLDLEWNTEGRGIGDFAANVKVYVDEAMIEEKDIPFKILERGSILAEAAVIKVDNPDEISKGTVSKTEVEVYNSGKIDIKAKVTGEVYVSGKLVDTIDSDEVLVKVNRNEIITSYFKSEDNGDYVIKRSVVFEGKKLELEDLAFTLEKGKESVNLNSKKVITSQKGDGFKFSIIHVLIIICVLLLVLGILLIVLAITLKKGKKKKK